MDAFATEGSGVDRRYARPGRRADTRARRREEQSLAEALDHGRLALVHARRWRLSDGAHVADEATPHWPRAFRATSSAALAAAVTSDAALAARLGRWMLQADYGGAARRVAVSLLLPAAMPRDSCLLDAVRAALARTGLAPEHLELRFAEAALLDRSTEALLCLSALRDAGIAIAVDDWGRRTGSLSLLRDMPLTTIRLDPALTHGVGIAHEDEAVAFAVVRMAHALGIAVVAQGVDSAVQRDVLCRLGVDAAIGWCGQAGAPARSWPAPPAGLAAQ